MLLSLSMIYATIVFMRLLVKFLLVQACKCFKSRILWLQLFWKSSLHGKRDSQWISLGRGSKCWSWLLQQYGLLFFLYIMLILEENTLVIPSDMEVGLVNCVSHLTWLQLQFTSRQMLLRWSYFLSLLLVSILRSQTIAYAEPCLGGLG